LKNEESGGVKNAHHTHKNVKTMNHVEKNTVASCYTRSGRSAFKHEQVYLGATDLSCIRLRNNILLRHCGLDLQSPDLHNVVLLFEIAGLARNENSAHNDHLVHLVESPVTGNSGIYPRRLTSQKDVAPTSTTGTSQHINIDICEHDGIMTLNLLCGLKAARC
jgi:hypothetical protein